MTEKLEIEKTLVLSTGHISKEASEYLEDATDKGLIVDSYPYGWRVFVGPYAVPIPVGHSSIQDCLELAKKHDCSWVKFDQDGDFVDELKQWEW